MAIKPINFLTFILSVLLSCFSFFVQAEDINAIHELFKDAKEGDWVLAQSKKNYQTKTKILKRNGSLLTLEIENIIKGQIESKTVQKIDLEQNKIIKAEIISDDGEVMVIPINDLLFNKMKVTKYAQIREEKITVPKGTFLCKVYKAIADDQVVWLWMNDSVPVNHIVQIKIKHTLAKLVDYGSTTQKDNSLDAKKIPL